jgi:hypothetical protein
MKNYKRSGPFVTYGLTHGLTLSGAAIVCLLALQGCAVVAVADTVGTIAVKTVGLAADAAIGVVKISGKAVGAVADAAIPDAK